MKCYKGFDKDLKCRGFQYEIEGEYEEKNAELCKSGFHACENPLDVFNYYSPADSRYCEVELEDVQDKKDTDSKRVGKRIKIGAEVGIKGIVDAGVKFVLGRVDWSDKKNTNTGDQSAATNTGDQSAATNTGYQSAATNTGYQSAATNTGNLSAATNTGYRSAATNTGDQSAASVSGEESVALAIGANSKAKGEMGCWIVLSEWEDGHIISVKSHEVDGITIKPNVWYVLQGGKFKEVKNEQ